MTTPATKLFDYNSLTPVVSSMVMIAAERIKLRMKRTVEDILEIGRELKEVKEHLPHGQFLPWIEAEFGMSEWSAQKFMQAFKQYGSKSLIITDLSPTVLYELSAPSTPEPVREAIESRAASGESVTVKEVKELKQQLKDLEEQKNKRIKGLFSEKTRAEVELANVLKSQEQKDESREAYIKDLATEIEKLDEELTKAKAEKVEIVEKVVKQEVVPPDYEDLKNERRRLQEKLEKARQDGSTTEQSIQRINKELEKTKAQLKQYEAANREAEIRIKLEKALALVKEAVVIGDYTPPAPGTNIIIDSIMAEARKLKISDVIDVEVA